jgi:hypothetical protein
MACMVLGLTLTSDPSSFLTCMVMANERLLLLHVALQPCHAWWYGINARQCTSNPGNYHSLRFPCTRMQVGYGDISSTTLAEKVRCVLPISLPLYTFAEGIAKQSKVALTSPSPPSPPSLQLWAIATMIVSGFFFSYVVGRMAALGHNLSP